MERRITILVEKYMNGTGTAAEIAELHEWVSRSATDDAIHEALEKAWHTYQPDRRMPDDISHRILTAVFSDDQADPQKIQQVPIRRNFRPFASGYSGMRRRQV